MSVKKYRKKPVVIEAMQYDGRNTVEVAEWLRASGVRVGWSNATMIIPTLEGRMEASPGDWVIRGVQGEFYPCKPDIFEQTYEASEQTDREPSNAKVRDVLYFALRDAGEGRTVAEKLSRRLSAALLAAQGVRS